jgi:hypothetical protein
MKNWGDEDKTVHMIMQHPDFVGTSRVFTDLPSIFALGN